MRPYSAVKKDGCRELLHTNPIETALQSNLQTESVQSLNRANQIISFLSFYLHVCLSLFGLSVFSMALLMAKLLL